MKKSNITLLRDIQILLSENISKKLLNELNDKLIVTNKDTGNSYQVSKEYYNAHKAQYDIAKPGTKSMSTHADAPKKKPKKNPNNPKSTDSEVSSSSPFKAVKSKSSPTTASDIANLSSVGSSTVTEPKSKAKSEPRNLSWNDKNKREADTWLKGKTMPKKAGKQQDEFMYNKYEKRSAKAKLIGLEKYEDTPEGTKFYNASSRGPKYAYTVKDPDEIDYLKKQVEKNNNTKPMERVSPWPPKDTQSKASKPAKSPYKSLEKIMNSDIFDGAKYDWETDGPKIQKAMDNMSEQGQLAEDDVMDLYLHTTAGTPLNNKSLAKRKGFKEFEQAMEQASNNIIERDDY